LSLPGLSLVYYNNYFPYPDSMIDFAFPLRLLAPLIGKPKLQNEYWSGTLPKFSHELDRILTADVVNTFKNNLNQYMIVYPAVGQELFQWIAELQAWHQITGADTNFFSRIHPGSPHMYWRNLWAGAGSYEITDLAPAYHKVSNARLYPLGDNLGTQLVFHIHDSSVTSDEIAAQNASVFSPRVYCGDVQAEWENSYIKAEAGTFEKCRQLYENQIDLGRRMFKGERFIPQEMPAEISAAAKHDEHTPIISPLEALTEELKMLQSIINEEMKDYVEVNQLATSMSNASYLTSLEFDNDALQKYLDILKNRLDKTKKNYQDAKKKLFKLQKVPFLRPR
jgi:hypothetical protein